MFDVGHGCSSFAWDIYRPAIEQGFDIDTISTDLHRLSVDGPVFDLPTTMSKFLHAGHSLSAVVAAVTSRPAEVLARADDLDRSDRVVGQTSRSSGWCRAASTSPTPSGGRGRFGAFGARHDRERRHHRATRRHLDRDAAAHQRRSGGRLRVAAAPSAP